MGKTAASGLRRVGPAPPAFRKFARRDRPIPTFSPWAIRHSFRPQIKTSAHLHAGNVGTGDSTLWISFIGQRVGVNNVRFFGLSFYEGDVNTSANERFTIGENSNNSNDQWGAHFTNAGTPRLDVAGTSVTTESLLLARDRLPFGCER